MPLVNNLHGFTPNAAEQERLSGMSAKADEVGFIVVYPEALGNSQAWHVGPGAQGAADVEFIRDLIRHLKSQWSIDPGRIYATGISNGGGMVHRLACDLSDVIAAIAPVSGAYLFSKSCQPTWPVPVVAFHGTADQIVPYEVKAQACLPSGSGLPIGRPAMAAIRHPLSPSARVKWSAKPGMTVEMTLW